MADEDGVGGGLVDIMPGIRGFIANASPIETEPVLELTFEDREERMRTPRTVYANLKTQCAYLLADKVNKRLAAVRTDDVQIRTWITEDLEQIREANTEVDDQKKRLVPKDAVKEVLGRSPDFGDTLVMRAAFELREPKKAHTTSQTRPEWISKRRR